jgi:hypothetical protein
MIGTGQPDKEMPLKSTVRSRGRVRQSQRHVSYKEI